MTGHRDTDTPSGITGAFHVASDIKNDQSDFMAGISATNVMAMALIATLAIFLITELAWKERQRRRRADRAAPPPDANLRKGKAP
ncbi:MULTISPECIES: hypothetical protein [Streptomyces]|uniref:Uncharacterized protein n=1 Tax=Streptomyces plicatus TaxID=1922 RepID=A0ABW1Y8U8_STRPL|nr:MULTISPECIES: hypothetical protein [Streptomyces]RSS66349.1 hypothetical protein EF907_16550 [Streptomyces sp. WAC06273]GGZ73071.1 hypothetical protein GCM10010301_53210 [Streptomyces plicatus]GHC27963.1 hypothetical protein GCM10010308_51330 [Streptomyces vinaceusdrappus]